MKEELEEEKNSLKRDKIERMRKIAWKKANNQKNLTSKLAAVNYTHIS